MHFGYYLTPAASCRDQGDNVYVVGLYLRPKGRALTKLGPTLGETSFRGKMSFGEKCH
jgi:hypothetical protein